MKCLSAAGVAGLLLLSAAPAWSEDQVKVTVWTWAPDLEEIVAVYEKEHPNVDVEIVNAGTGPAEYEKVRNALRAGEGAPDVFFLAGSTVRSFADSDALVNLNDYGAGAVKDKTLPFAWSAGTVGDGQYFIPAGFGPMTYFYRADVFEKYGITVPKTWAELATAAEKLKAADPTLYLASFPSLDINVEAMFWQAGQKTFQVDGTTVKIDWTGDTAQRVASYWQDLLDRGLVSRATELSTEWNQQIATGKLVGMMGGAWYPLVLEPTAPDQSGLWRVATIPQWDKDTNVSADAGLAGYAVTQQSKHPKEASEFTIWLTSAEVSQKMLHQMLNQLPTYLPVLHSDELMNEKSEFFGGQEINKVFLQSADAIGPYQFSPFHDYVHGQFVQQAGRVLQGVITFPKALDDLQNAFEVYAEDQGYTVAR